MWKLCVLGSELEPSVQQPQLVAKYLTKIPSDEIPDDAAEYVEEVQKLYGQDGIYRSFPIQPLSWPIGAKIDLLTRQFGDAETGIAAVSFAAAALWLFLERVMNLSENRVEMRIQRSAWFPRDLRFPHS